VHVIATAGHVDHGKSTLVRALTGTDPDRLAEEHRRGLSIQLGYCWTTLPGAGDIAFVDVPGHERFISTMLSGIGPVPAVLFVVAADDPWMPQAAEHLAALDALGVGRGVLAVTRADLADPGPALERARAELARTGLRDAPAVAVSGRTGQGLDELRGLLGDLVRALPDPPADSDVRLWVDRCFHVKGAGTVVTGTLQAGRISIGDTLALGRTSAEHTEGRAVRVRDMQSLGRQVDTSVGVSRVALNISGGDVDEVDRSSVLVTPGRWLFTDVVDVRVSTGSTSATGSTGGDTGVPERPLLHIGATSLSVHVRPLGAGLARLGLDRPLPLRIGDRALLRDPGSRRVWGAAVLDPAPPGLERRGAARTRAVELAAMGGTTDQASEVSRRGIVRRSLLEQIGVGGPDARGTVTAGAWLVSEEQAAELRKRMGELVAAHEREAPLEQGIPLGALTRALGVPSADIVTALVAEPLRLVDGRVTARAGAVLPSAVEKAVNTLAEDLRQDPFAAPTADRLRDLGLDGKAVAAAARAGRLLKVADGIVLLPGAARLAAAWLADLPQPFTTSQARQRLGTSRRVALPLLGHLDELGYTRRLPDDRRILVDNPGGG
jgi:selenocysteine-specific elongation factor